MKQLKSSTYNKVGAAAAEAETAGSSALVPSGTWAEGAGAAPVGGKTASPCSVGT